MTIATGEIALASDVNAAIAAVEEREIHIPLLYASGPATSYAESHTQLTGNALDAAAEYMRGSFKVPNYFTTLVGARLTFVARTTGTFDYTFTTHWGAVGENFLNDSDSITADGKAIVDNVVNSIDISLAFTGIVANDSVNVCFTLDVLTTTTSVIIGYISLWYK